MISSVPQNKPVITSISELSKEVFGEGINSDPITQTINSLGRKLFIRTWGNPDDPTVLCLHSGGLSSLEFSLIGPALASQNFHVVALDHSGHGNSAWIGHVRRGAIENEINAVQTFFNKPKISIIGASLGGLFAADYAAKNPDLIEKLILCDIAPALRKGVLRGAHHFFLKPYSKPIETEDQLEIFHSTISKSIYGKALLSLTNRENYHEATTALYPKYDPSFLEVINDKSFLDYWGAFEKIRCPSLLLLGEVSKHVPKNAVHRMSERVKGDFSVQVISGAGHCLVLDAPHDVFNAIHLFLQ
jgi:pimeloyl-ACP methyl ester carboxylesterase